jgi:hypothetical protein
MPAEWPACRHQDLNLGRTYADGSQPSPVDHLGMAARYHGRDSNHTQTPSGLFRIPRAFIRLAIARRLPREGFEPSKIYSRVLSPLPLATWLPRQWMRTESNSHRSLWRRVSCRWTTHPEQDGGRAI